MKPDVFLFNPEWQCSCAKGDVYHGAHRILDQLFPQAKLQSSFLEIKVVPEEKLEKISDVWGLDKISANFRHSLSELAKRQPNRSFMIAGTCGAEAAPVAYLNEKYDGKIAVLWFDAHADINLPKDSASGFFHGMVLRSLLGEGPAEFTGAISKPLKPKQIFYVGLRDPDPDEVVYIQQHKITEFMPDADNAHVLCQLIKDQGFEKIYVHLDLDILDPEEFPNTLMHVPGGPTLENVRRCLETLKDHFDVIGFSVVEHVERRPGYYPQLKKLIDAILN